MRRALVGWSIEAGEQVVDPLGAETGREKVANLRDSFDRAGDALVIILDAGRATLELANPAQVDMIDRVEVGARVSPHVRLAFEVDDTAASTDRLVANGATLIAAPVETPWRSVNSRLHAPGGLRLTLFAEFGTADD